jgi:hypothetical protein
MVTTIDMETQHKAELDNWFQEYTKLWKVAPPASQNILSKDEFAAVLESFFEITLDPMVFGNLTRKDGGQWASSKEAFNYWRDSVGLNARHADIIYRAVDEVTPYT